MPSVYPKIKRPQKQSDGSYLVEVLRDHDDVEQITAENLQSAREIVAALERAKKIFETEKIGVIDKISGVNKNTHTYTVRWLEDGRPRSFSNRDRKIVAARRDRLKGQEKAKGKKLKRHRDFGSAAFFRSALDEAVEANRVAVNDRDFDAIKLTKGRLDAIHTASQAWHPHSGVIELEQAFEHLVNKLERAGYERIRERAQELRTSTTKLAGAIRCADGSGPAVSSDGTANEGKGRGEGRGLN